MLLTGTVRKQKWLCSWTKQVQMLLLLYASLVQCTETKFVSVHCTSEYLILNSVGVQHYVMGPLQLTVTWYKIHHAVMQVHTTTSKTKKIQI